MPKIQRSVNLRWKYAYKIGSWRKHHLKLLYSNTHTGLDLEASKQLAAPIFRIQIIFNISVKIAIFQHSRGTRQFIGCGKFDALADWSNEVG